MLQRSDPRRSSNTLEGSRQHHHVRDLRSSDLLRRFRLVVVDVGALAGGALRSHRFFGLVEPGDLRLDLSVDVHLRSLCGRRGVSVRSVHPKLPREGRPVGRHVSGRGRRSSFVAVELRQVGEHLRFSLESIVHEARAAPSAFGRSERFLPALVV